MKKLYFLVMLVANSFSFVFPEMQAITPHSDGAVSTICQRVGQMTCKDDIPLWQEFKETAGKLKEIWFKVPKTVRFATYFSVVMIVAAPSIFHYWGNRLHQDPATDKLMQDFIDKALIMLKDRVQNDPELLAISTQKATEVANGVLASPEFQHNVTTTLETVVNSISVWDLVKARFPGQQ